MEKRSFVIIIGNEILSGHTEDSNLSWLGKRLDQLGAPVVEARIIPDVKPAIIDTVGCAKASFDYVFTTGGIGPTHDDITTESVAQVFAAEIERSQEARVALGSYYPASDLNDSLLKMADIPVGAKLIDNPVTGAPGFQLENVFVFPGVPKIMRVMFDGIADRIVSGSRVFTRSVITDLRESQLAETLKDLQKQYPNISIGSYPFSKYRRFGVNLTFRGNSISELDCVEQAARSAIKQLKENSG